MVCYLTEIALLLLGVADHSVVVPTSRTDRAQELHLCIQHAICDAIEQTL